MITYGKLGEMKRTENQTKRKKYLKLTLKSDLNVGCAIPMEDVCCKRFGAPPISVGLFNRMPTGGGGGAKNPDAADGGNDVTVAFGNKERQTNEQINSHFSVQIFRWERMTPE